MPDIHITLPPNLTTAHFRVVLKYFKKSKKFTSQEWKLAIESFNILGKANIIIDKKQMSFQQFYDYYVDIHYADNFLIKLISMEDLENQAENIQNITGFEILSMLERKGFYHKEVPGSEYLAAYCLYWWTSFSKGYRFELMIYRDLKASGILFIAHDFSSRKERRTPYDLIVLKKLGDIKSTTYFLLNVCTISMGCDFYITRIFDTKKRQYISIVLMKESFWRELNGEVITTSIETVTNYLPQPVQIVLQSQRYVIIPFELWKEKVKERQKEEN